MYDVVIVGAGICGASIARELSRYALKVMVLEKENDVGVGTTKANSGIVHAGYDPLPGSLMAKYNVWGNRLMEGLCEALQVPYQKIGSFVLAFSKEDLDHLQKLYDRGVQNGVEGLRIVPREELLQLEPHLNPDLQGGLYAPSAAVVGPYELAIALMDQAVVNGVTVQLNHKVVGIKWQGDHFVIEANYHTAQKQIESRYIVNCGGLYADEIARLLESVTFTIKPQKGQYYLLDKTQGKLVKHVMFQCPTEKGKGILVAPTAHGNLIVGPDAEEVQEGEDVSTSMGSLAYIREMAAKTCGEIAYGENIRNFSGNRAITNEEDFIIGYANTTNQWVNVAGIKSPGLTSAPAIALDVVQLLGAAGLQLQPKETFVKPEPIPRIGAMSQAQCNEWIKRNPAFGHIVCRCEKITEGEIVAAIHSPVPATTVEAVKRRVRAGAGRCQGGFCSPKVVAILARELGLPYEDICLDQEESYILEGRAPKGGEGSDSGSI